MTSIAMLRTASFAVAITAVGAFGFPQDAGQPSAPKAEQQTVKHPAIAKVASRPEDVSTIDGMIKAYYEVVSGPAGQPRQWDRDATLYIPGMRFVVITEDKNGNASAQSMTHQEFVDSTEAAMHGKPFFERECHRVLQQVGNIAHVLSTTEQATSADGPYKVSGLDSLDLLWDGKRWWIASANLWEINSKVHSLPPEYLPK